MINSITIGEFDFNDYSFILTEEEISDQNNRPNFKKGINKCKVEVYSGEGPNPHFHLFNLSGDFHMCALIYSANYFSHGGKYTDTLNSNQREILNNWLDEKNKDNDNITNWEAIALKWNNFNPRWAINMIGKIKPDYSDMKTFKDK